MTGTGNLAAFAATHFSCFGAVIPTHKISGSNCRILEIISSFSQSDHCPKGGDRVATVIRGKFRFTRATNFTSASSRDPRKNTFPPVRSSMVIADTKKSEPVILGPTESPASAAPHIQPTPSATTALVPSSALRNSASCLATTKEWGFAHAKMKESLRTRIAVCADATSSASERVPMRTPNMRPLVISSLTNEPQRNRTSIRSSVAVSNGHKASRG